MLCACRKVAHIEGVYLDHGTLSEEKTFFNTYTVIQKGSDPLVSDVGPGTLCSSTMPVSTRYLIASATLFYRHVTLGSNHFISSTSQFQSRWRDSSNDWTDKRCVRLNEKVRHGCAGMYVGVHVPSLLWAFQKQVWMLLPWMLAMRLSACLMCSTGTRVHQKGQFVPLVGETDSAASDVTQLCRCSAVTRPSSLVCLFHSTQQVLLF